MKIKLDTKFMIGEVVKPVTDTTGWVVMQVIEVIIQKCYAATQIHYDCRVYTKGDKLAPPSIARSLYRFTEPEIENWSEWADKKENKS